MISSIGLLEVRLEVVRPNDIEFSGEKEGAAATDAESAAMSC
jgi:hypothetical protein